MDTGVVVAESILGDINSMLRYPLMWGGYFAVELQLLFALQVYALSKRPDQEQAMLDAEIRALYLRVIEEHFSNDVLCATVAEFLVDSGLDEEKVFRDVMSDFCQRVLGFVESIPHQNSKAVLFEQCKARLAREPSRPGNPLWIADDLASEPAAE